MAKRKSIADYESEWAAKDAARGETFVVPRKPTKRQAAEVVDPRSEIYSRAPIVNPSDEDYLKAYTEAGSEFLNMPKNARDLGVHLGKKAYEYAVDTTPAQFREDLKKGHAAAFRAVPRALESALRHPLDTLAELSPVGSVQAAVDAADMSAQLRSLGDLEGASLAAKSAGPMGLMAALDVAQFAPGVGAATKGLAAAAKRGAYTVAKDGAFRNVARRGVENEIVRMPEAANASLAQIRTLAQDPARSPLIRIANKHSMAAHGKPFDTAEAVPASSLQRQAAVGRALREANTGNHAFEHAIYEGYGNAYPELIDQTGAQNYDQLREAAYNQLGKELGVQFDDLPLKLRYHDGPGEYASSTDMARDVLGNGQLNVFSGGDPHDFLDVRDPRNGLSLNEQLRAVHDTYGHALIGSQFGPQGELAAYMAHKQMLSPLASLGLAGETHMQNSLVNFSPLNADVLAAKKTLQRQARERLFAEEYLRGERPGYPDEARRALEELPSAEEILRMQRELGQQMQFAPQKAVIPPHEFLDPNYMGGMPDRLRALLSEGKDPLSARGVHFSRSGDLTATDPSFFGTGHRGAEYLPTKRGGLPDRTYFYSGEPGTVSAELPVQRGVQGVYEAPLQNLYDINVDPEGILRTAKAHNLTDYKPALGYLVSGTRFEPSSALPDMERMVKDYGYSGYISDYGGQRAAAIYDPVENLRKLGIDPTASYADGGLVVKRSGMPC